MTRVRVFNDSTVTEESNVVHFAMSSPLGSTGRTVGNDGSDSGIVRYTPYGSTRTGDVANLPIDQTYTGQTNDPGTGLIDYNARQYDPQLGRFIQPDTIVPDMTNPQDLNRYTYVSNNPINYTDPTGHEVCDVTYTYCWDASYNGPLDLQELATKQKTYEEVFEAEEYEDPGPTSGGAPLLEGIIWAADKTFDATRFTLNAPTTAVGYGWAELNGGDCSMNGDLLLVCTNVNAWANGDASNFVIGNVILSENPVVSEKTLDHERDHSTQWAALGPFGFLTTYFAGEAVSQALGKGPCLNALETVFASENGRYSQC